MYSVSQRARTYKQPRGGFISPKSFAEYNIDKIEELYDEENISPSLVGLAVDYMTRFILTDNAYDAFKIPLMGAKLLNNKELKKAEKLVDSINGLNDESVISACKLTGYDSVLRAGISVYKPIEEINPDAYTISNVIIMVKRSLSFFDIYGPVLSDGFGFLGGYTSTVISGDADFLTKDTIWDFKTSKKELSSYQTLQLYMYYLMGCRAFQLNIEYDFKNKIKNLGFFNPRLSRVYILPVSSISNDVKNIVENDVIGYGAKEIDPYLLAFLKNK